MKAFDDIHAITMTRLCYIFYGGLLHGLCKLLHTITNSCYAHRSQLSFASPTKRLFSGSVYASILGFSFILPASSLYGMAMHFDALTTSRVLVEVFHSCECCDVKSRLSNVLLFLFTTFEDYISWYLLARHISASHSFCDMYDTWDQSHIAHQFHLRPLYKHT